MFDKVKFSLLIAFPIVFKINTRKKGMSSLELSQEFELRQPTCWAFKWKIQQAMQSSKQNDLTGEVQVDGVLLEVRKNKNEDIVKEKKRLVYQH